MIHHTHNHHLFQLHTTSTCCHGGVVGRAGGTRQRSGQPLVTGRRSDRARETAVPERPDPGPSGMAQAGVTALRRAAALSDDATLTFRSCARPARWPSTPATTPTSSRSVSVPPSCRPPQTWIATSRLRVEPTQPTSPGTTPWRRAAAAALELADRIHDPMCLISAAATVARQGLAADGLPYADRAVEIAREQALVTALPFALQAQTRALIGWSQFDRAYSAAEEGWRLGSMSGSPGPEPEPRLSRADRRVQRSRVTGAHALSGSADARRDDRRGSDRSQYHDDPRPSRARSRQTRAGARSVTSRRCRNTPGIEPRARGARRRRSRRAGRPRR